jgi:glycosyltransferase involved in cell wall biosynthesis
VGAEELVSGHPTISVVVPSLDRLERISPLVAHYLEQGADEIVVVLDGPHPGWLDILDQTVGLPGVIVRELPANGGLALARVAGLGFATMDVVLLADDDVVPGPDLIARHKEFHAAHPGEAMLGYMPVELPPRRSRDQAPTFVYARDYENQVAEWRTASSLDLLESFWGGNSSVPRELYLRAEAYLPSQRLNYNEDLDLGLRLKAIGATARFNEAARSSHRHSRDFASFRRECIVRGQAVSDMKSRWPSLPGRMTELVEIPADHHGAVAGIQGRIGALDEPGILEALIVLAYRVTGLTRQWKIQDALARLIRRGLAIRGYRLSELRTG